MQVGAEFGQVSDSLDDLGEELFVGVAGDEFNPFDSIYFAYGFKEVGKAVGFAACGVLVGIDCLAEEGDLFYAGVGEFADLLEYGGWGPGYFGAADVGNYAVCAEIVTASHSTDVGLAWQGVVRQGVSGFEVVEGVLVGGGLFFPDILCNGQMGFFLVSRLAE